MTLIHSPIVRQIPCSFQIENENFTTCELDEYSRENKSSRKKKTEIFLIWKINQRIHWIKN